jgi:hypothetical protein
MRHDREGKRAGEDEERILEMMSWVDDDDGFTG